MKIVEPFRKARETLGVEPGADAAAVRRAYRAAVQRSAPDRDPEGFRRIRDAYELLIDPADRAFEWMASPLPLVVPPPPEPDRENDPLPALVEEALRFAAAALVLARSEAGTDAGEVGALENEP